MVVEEAAAATGMEQIAGLTVNALAKFGVVFLYGAFLGIPIIIAGIFIAYALLYKYKVVIHEPHGRITFTKGMITKKGVLVIRKPKHKLETFDLEACSLDNKGQYVFHFYKENNDSYRQVKPIHIDKDKNLLVHVSQEKSVDFLLENWSRAQKSVFTLEGWEKYKDFAFIGLIVVFNIVSMSLLLKAAGLGV